jgi:hypothetical protein
MAFSLAINLVKIWEGFGRRWRVQQRLCELGRFPSQLPIGLRCDLGPMALLKIPLLCLYWICPSWHLCKFYIQYCNGWCNFDIYSMLTGRPSLLHLCREQRIGLPEQRHNQQVDNPHFLLTACMKALRSRSHAAIFLARSSFHQQSSAGFQRRFLLVLLSFGFSTGLPFLCFYISSFINENNLKLKYFSNQNKFQNMNNFKI